MTLIPGPCGDVSLPDECFDYPYQAASCILDAAREAIEDFIPSLPECENFVSFVTFSASGQPDDTCNQLTVLIEYFRPKALGRKQCATRWEVKMRVELVVAGYPEVEPIAEGQFVYPTAAAQDAAARWMYALGLAFTLGIQDVLRSPSCEELQRATNRTMSDVKAAGPRGGCAGWVTTITFEV